MSEAFRADVRVQAAAPIRQWNGRTILAVIRQGPSIPVFMSFVTQKAPWFIAGICVGLLVALNTGLLAPQAGVPTRGLDNLQSAIWPQQASIPASLRGSGGDAAPLPAAEGYAEALAAVVRVFGPTSAGSGVVYSADGLALTNAHVVGDVAEVRVAVGNRVVTAKVTRFDERRDLALLELPPGAYAFARLGEGRDAVPGTRVAVAGYPLNLEGAASLTSGIISRYVHEPRNGRELLQTDAAINLGSSGGPVLDEQGRVVGIVTSFLGDYESFSARGIGFAVSVDSVREWLAAGQ